MRGRIERASCPRPVIHVKTRKWKTGLFKEPVPADAFNPFADTLPILGILLVTVQNFFHSLGQRGGLFGKPATTSFWKEGLERALEFLPPIQIASLECSGSLICMGGQGG